MSKQITITIPNELAKRLEVYKKQKRKINISKICQVALDNEIKECAGKSKEDANLEAIINRLRREKEETSRADFLYGYKEGTKWAQKANYNAIVILGVHWKTSNEIQDGAALDLEKLSEDYQYELGAESPGNISRMFYNISRWSSSCPWEFRYRRANYKDDEGPSPGETSEDVLPEYRQFEDGFVQAVRDFWNQIKDRL